MGNFSQSSMWVLVEKENSIHYGNTVITDIVTNTYTQSLTNRTHQQIINVCYKMKYLLYTINDYRNEFVCMYIYIYRIAL